MHLRPAFFFVWTVSISTISLSALVACGGKLTSGTQEVTPEPGPVPPPWVPAPDAGDTAPPPVPDPVPPSDPPQGDPDASTASSPAVPVGAGVLAWAQEGPNSVALDGTNVYWANWGTSPNFNDGTILVMPLGGGTPMALATGQGQPMQVAVRGANIYWTTQLGKTVMTMPTSGGPLVTLATGTDALAIAVDDKNVYWSNFRAADNGGAILSVPLTGGKTVTIAANQPAVRGVAVDATNVYWTCDGLAGTVMRAPIGGGEVTTIASNQNLTGGIAVDETGVYWLTGSAVMKASLPGIADGGAPVTLAAGDGHANAIGVDGDAFLALDAAYVYWTAGDASGTVSKVPKGGGPVTVVATGQLQPTGIAVGPTGIYWGDLGTYGNSYSGSLMFRSH